MKGWLDSLVDASPIARHVAWAGEVSFLRASEDDKTGRVVMLMLHRRPEELRTAHPFSAHTRRRRGHAGSMFEAAFSPIGLGPDFAGGVMLLNWGAAPKGETVTLLLNYESDRHPFFACTRAAKDQEPTRWMATFVEVDDQSAPVDRKQRDAVERPRKPKQQIKNSNLAAQFIKNPRFWKYMTEMYGGEVDSDREADAALKLLLGIDSKAELDLPSKAAEFDDLRIDFVDWQQITYGPEGLT